MTSFQSGFLSLIRAALLETEATLPKDFSFEEAYRIAEQHQVLPLIYYGAMSVPSFMQDPAFSLYFEKSCSYISHSANQMERLEQLFSLLEAAGVDYMPLKGTLLKGLYPSPEMRIMGDADVLIRTEDYAAVAPVMRSLPAMPLPESDHEYTWMLPGKLVIELHKRLIPSYNEDYYAYYGDGWRLARPVSEGSHRFEMSPEDTLIYLFTHFAKHYRDKGAGIKYVVDFFVYRRAYPELDTAYLEREMKKLCLWDFYQNVMRLVEVWFEGTPSDEKTDYMTHKIFDDGVFGKEENGIVSSGVKLSKTGGSVQRKRKLQLLFPSYSTMCSKYPVLKNWAILLPIFWLIRIFDALFFHKDRIRRRQNEINQMTDENIDAYRRELNYVGLDFNFGEDDPPPDGEE